MRIQGALEDPDPILEVQMIEGTGGQNFSQLREASFSRDHPGPRKVFINRIDQNDSGGLDFDEILALVDKTGRGSKVLENFTEIDQDKTES